MIFVLGSINMDIVARVPYVPKQGETMNADKFYVNQGGKGANQAVAIAKMGGQVKMIGKVGSDAFGVELKQTLLSYGVDITNVGDSKVNSGLAMIIVYENDNRIILDAGANYDVTEKDVDDGLKDAKEGDILIMQLEVPLSIVEYASVKAKEKGMITILNPAPAKELSDLTLANTDILAPNESETEILSGVCPNGDVELALAAKALYRKGVKKLLVTLGSRGSAVIEGQNITYVPAKKVNAVDTTSAGDTFVGATALMLSKGKTLLESAQFATYASAITVQREGAAQSIPTLEEVQAFIDSEKSVN